MKTPDIKPNPNPTKRYEIAVTIDGAPGSFDSVGAIVQYEVENNQCVPLQAGSGARLAPDKSIPLQLTKTGNVYKSTFYIDQLQDEDYYGLGVCHWSIVGISANLKVRAVTFSSDLFRSEILSQKLVYRYFPDRAYSKVGISGVVTGNAERADFKEDVNKTFSVSLVAKATQS
jgi:hypothetical protein